MPDTDPDTNQPMVYCRSCGERIKEEAEICPHCGVRQKESDVDTNRFLNQYSLLTWIGSGILSIITFPLGLLVPAYFIYKAWDRSGIEQGRWEVWAVLLSNFIGMIAVELGGETGGKVIVALNILAFFGIIFAAILGTFILGLGSNIEYITVLSAAFGV